MKSKVSLRLSTGFSRTSGLTSGLTCYCSSISSFYPASSAYILFCLAACIICCFFLNLITSLVCSFRF